MPPQMNVETQLLRVNRDGTRLDYDSNGDDCDEKDTTGSSKISSVEKTKEAPVGNGGLSRVITDYGLGAENYPILTLRRIKPAMPTKPVPSKPRVPGSGVVVVDVDVKVFPPLTTPFPSLT